MMASSYTVEASECKGEEPTEVNGRPPGEEQMGWDNTPTMFARDLSTATSLGSLGRVRSLERELGQLHRKSAQP